METVLSAKKVHLIAGLPRSGSTLLSAILRQNPRFQASISSPLHLFVSSIVRDASRLGYRHECPPEKRRKIVAGIFDSYCDAAGKEVYFDTNRGWGTQFHLVKDLWPEAKMIMCVRSVGWVIDSFERLVTSNPFVSTTMFAPKENVNVYTRFNALMRPENIIGGSLSAMKQVLVGQHRSSVMVLEYDALTKNPENCMQAVYRFLGEGHFEHDFNDVESSYPEYDEDFQAPGLHHTRKEVKFVERESILPPDIWQRVEKIEFWRRAVRR